MTCATRQLFPSPAAPASNNDCSPATSSSATVVAWERRMWELLIRVLSIRRE